MSFSSAHEDLSESNQNSDFLDCIEDADVDLHRWRWRAESRREETSSRELVFHDTRVPYGASSKELSLSGYMRHAARFQRLTQEEEVNLAERALKCDEQARQKLVLSNLRLVVKFAKRYKDRGIDFEDLVQEGNLGLIRASQSYDPSKGTRFSTYASMWIIQFISRMVDNKARSIRLPIRVHKDIRTVKQIVERVRAYRGTEPSLAEIVRYSKLSEARVKAAFKNMVSPVSLNQESGFGHTSEIVDQIVYDDGVCVESPAEQHLDKAYVGVLIESLTAEEYEVVLLRYGLRGNTEIGFKEISERTGLSLGKVKRLHLLALKKMKKKADLMSRSVARQVTKSGDFALPG
jgi:RNA polymerase sigma factor (sigma-70 family)